VPGEQGAGPEEDAQKWTAQVAAAAAAIKEAQAEEVRARLRYTSEIDGVHTTVAAVQAELDRARYYLENTLMVAPEVCVRLLKAQAVDCALQT
jgi:multidrug resistance efflux pump